MPSREEIEKKAEDEYKAALGRVVLAERVDGYLDDNSISILCDPPARLRVIQTPRGDILHWNCKEWLDPYWNLELVDYHPALREVKGLYTYGINSHHVDGKIEPTSEWVFEDQQTKPEGT